MPWFFRYKLEKLKINRILANILDCTQIRCMLGTGYILILFKCPQTQSHNWKKLLTTATEGEGEMTCPNTDGGAHGDRGHCVWQQMLCDSHQVISSTIFIIKIIIIWQQKQLAPKPTLSLSSLLWAVFTGVFFYISQSSPIRQSKIYPDFVLVLFHFP